MFACVSRFHTLTHPAPLTPPHPCPRPRSLTLFPHPPCPAGVVGGLVDMVRSAAKEKLVRIALLALQNLLSVGPASLEYAVVEKGLPKAVSNRLLQVRAGLQHGSVYAASACVRVLLGGHTGRGEGRAAESYALCCRCLPLGSALPDSAFPPSFGSVCPCSPSISQSCLLSHTETLPVLRRTGTTGHQGAAGSLCVPFSQTFLLPIPCRSGTTGTSWRLGNR